MTAAAIIKAAIPLVRLVCLLGLMAESAAGSCELFSLDVSDVVDPLQDFAHRTGLVAAIGQDAVQEIIAAPFAHSIAVLGAA
jgi:hypothetical protein